MNGIMRIAGAALVLLLLGVAVGLGQAPGDAGEKDKKPEKITQPPDAQDPTTPGPIFKDILGKKDAKGPYAPKLPSILLKGRIVPKGKPPAALLEVDGKLYLVNQKSMLSGSANVTLKILELNASEIRIEIGPQKDIMVLR